MGKYAVHVAVGVVLTALVLQTWGVLGVFVPIGVSAGSMANTYLGPHRAAACRACGAAIVCGLEQLPADGQAYCLNCGARGTELSDAADLPGTQVWIDRATFEFRAPRRWEPIVFRWPGDARNYFLKRVVGLPGETIAIHEGDVYVDGQIARKPWAAARSMAQFVHDDAFAATPPRGEAPQWRPRGDDSRWSRMAGGFSRSGTRQSSGRSKNGERPELWRLPLPPEFDWLEFHPLAGKPITDDSTYNQSETRRLNDVFDVGLSCEVRATGAGVLAVRLVDGADVFDAQFRPATGQVELRRREQAVQTANASPGRYGQFCRLEAALVDRQFWLCLAGEVVLAYPYEPTQPRQAAERPLAVGAAGLEVELRGLRVWRDVYYLEPPQLGGRRGKGTTALGPEAFFVLGDNSPISLDSRVLPGGGIPRTLIVGKPLPTK